MDQEVTEISAIEGNLWVIFIAFLLERNTGVYICMPFVPINIHNYYILNGVLVVSLPKSKVYFNLHVVELLFSIVFRFY